jgi:competence protein ComEC
MELAAPVLVFPHHGGRPGNCNVSSFTQLLCNVVCPETVVFSFSRAKYALPRSEVIETIRSHSPRTRIACTQLSKHCAEVLPESDPTHLVDVYALGRKARSCCAGTLVVSTRDCAITPCRADHDEFISVAAPSALCVRLPKGE